MIVLDVDPLQTEIKGSDLEPRMSLNPSAPRLSLCRSLCDIHSPRAQCTKCGGIIDEVFYLFSFDQNIFKYIPFRSSVPLRGLHTISFISV